MNVRDLVYRSLLAIEKSGKYSNLELTATIDSDGLEGKDKALYTALLYGVTERKITLDYFIEKSTGKSIGRLDLPVVILLRMGIYQILFLDRIPDSAAVNETVKLGGRYAARAKGFLNGVLRSFCRTKDALPYPDRSDSYPRWASVYYSVPEWIVESWMTDYPARVEGILESLVRTPAVTLRVNTLRCSRDRLMESYPDLLTPCSYSNVALRIASSYPLSDFSPLTDGLCYVQDEASQMAGLALDAHPGDLILDVCAAPGGKSFFAAIASGDGGRVISMDIHESKLSLIRNSAQRLGIRNIEVVANDSTVPIEGWVGKADRVICDVPCSGLGVLSKKSDLRNNVSKDLDKLENIQYNILVASSRYLKPGGILVYSTCTLHKAENEHIITRFLDEHPEFETLPFTVGSLDAPDGMATLFPSIHFTDGFFIAKLRRK